jgi:hypothetical protein
LVSAIRREWQSVTNQPGGSDVQALDRVPGFRQAVEGKSLVGGR